MVHIFLPPQAGESATQPDNGDPTQVGGQDPDSLFGVPISYFTGAAGSPQPGGDTPESADPTLQPNQAPNSDAFTGAAGFNSTGAPGSQGVVPSAAGAPIMVTAMFPGGQPGGGSGNNMVTVNDSISGPDDSTATASNYPPARPILAGDFYPTSTGAGSGTVHVGGNAIRP